MIYFLRHPHTGSIKIGKTINYSTRLSQLISQYGDLELIGLMEGYTEQEKYLHSKFKHLRDNSLFGREWFKPDSELMAYIENSASMNFPLPFHDKKSSSRRISQSNQHPYVITSKLMATSDLINLLFSHVLENDETEYKNAFVAEATGLNPVMLHNYRTGKTTSITTETVSVLSDFFGVPPVYFFSQTEQEAISVIASSTQSPTALSAIALPDKNIPYINDISNIILLWDEGDRATISKLVIQMLQTILKVHA